MKTEAALHSWQLLGEVPVFSGTVRTQPCPTLSSDSPGRHNENGVSGQQLNSPVGSSESIGWKILTGYRLGWGCYLGFI